MFQSNTHQGFLLLKYFPARAAQWLFSCSPLLPFPICSCSTALLSPKSFSESKKQGVMTEPHILANGWPLPWHSAQGRDWNDLPDCEMRDRGETPGFHWVRACLQWELKETQQWFLGAGTVWIKLLLAWAVPVLHRQQCSLSGMLCSWVPAQQLLQK